jgi:hypothetical protein
MFLTFIFGVAIIGAALHLGLIQEAWCKYTMPKEDKDGIWVAEVWRSWFFGRGSTLYRGRFNDFEMACLAAKKQAKIADILTPKKYPGEMRTLTSTQRIWSDREDGIEFGVVHYNKVPEEHLECFPLNVFLERQ